MLPALRSFLALAAALVVAAIGPAATARAAEPTADLSRWAIEQMPGGTVVTRDGALVIQDVAGCTVWFREPIVAPAEITYTATVIERGGPRDRLSDLNCFWLAHDPRDPTRPPFAPGLARSGKFSDYDSLLTYYVGYGGNTNSTTRFRRYDGTSARPLRPEHDLASKDVLLAANHAYRIRLVAHADGTAEFWRDGEKIFTYRDPAPLRRGWFALRTVKSHIELRDFRVAPLR